MLDTISISDWIVICTTVILAATAFIAPYVVELLKYKFYSAKLAFKFTHLPPDCHKTKMEGGGVSFAVYYFRFRVKNEGRSQAEQCEVVLEKILKENSAGQLKELEGFSPVSLKWTGPENNRYFTIQPEREYYCDIGRIHHPAHEPDPAFFAAGEEQRQQNKFFFELPTRYFSQPDYLAPGKYEIQISVYCKNSKRITRTFKIVWSGKWKDDESEMLNELVIA